MYKLIAMDFDGTLLTTDKKVTDYTKKVLLELKQLNYIIVGVTARTLDSVKSVANINVFDYLILNNGGYIYDIKNNSGEYQEIISRKDYTSITEQLKDLSKRIDYCSKNFYYYYKETLGDERPFIKRITSLDEINEKILRMNIHISNEDTIDYCLNLITNNYKDLKCFIMEDSDNAGKWLVVSPKNIDKGVSLKKLGNKLKINTEEMIFFGDGPNDLEVIKLVGCGVAMSNAIDIIKSEAKYITLSNNQDGIAVFLEKYLLKR